MLLAVLCAGLMLAFAPLSRAAGDWHGELSLGGGDVWRARIPIDVTNRHHLAYAGFHVGLPVGKEPGQIDLVGVAASSIRVADADGTELLFDLRAPSGVRLVDGGVPEGAVLTIPVTVDPGESQRLFVYFDNPSAYKVPDYLNGRSRPFLLDTLEVRVGAVERLELASFTGDAPFWSEPGHTWEIRIPVTVVNTSEKPEEAIVQTPVARLKLLTMRGFNPRSLRVVDPESGQILPTRVAGDNLLFVAQVPARSVKRYDLYLSRDPEIEEGPELDYADLVEHPGNLAVNPSFEEGVADLPLGWTRIGAHLGDFERPKGGIVGERFARMILPESVTPDWTGWRQTVAVEPGAAYLFLTYVRVTDVRGGNVRLHAHILEETGDGVSRQFWSAGPDLNGTTDWTLLGGVIQTSSRAGTIELHLTMNVHGTLDHDGVVLMRTALAHHGEIEVNPALAVELLAVWQENPIVKVFQDTPPAAPGQLEHGIALYAARGEKEALQLVLRSSEEMRVEVTIDGLRQGDAELPPPEIAVVGYVPVLQSSGYHQTAIGRNEWERLSISGGERTDGWQGWWPDYLVPTDGTVELAAHRTQPLWITVDVPKDAKPGLYTGTIRIAGEGVEKEIPLSLRVWRFALPERPSLEAIYDLRSGPGWTVAASDRERETWWRFMRERRVSADHIRPEPEFRISGGRVVMDTMAFDRAAELYFDELQMAVAYFPDVFYAAGWAHPPRSFLGRPYGTEGYREAYREAVTLFWNHVKAKGWADRMVLYLSDEPFYDRPEVVRWLGDIIEIIREVDPEIPVYSSTWGFVPEWEGLLNHWGVAQDGRFPLDVMERRLRAGDKIWFTTDGQMEINTPYNAVERVLPYYAFAHGVDGYEFWGISWYTYDPYQYGWHSFIRQSERPGDEFWVRYPHGDGYLAYPGELIGLDGPVSTIRLEQAREGLEDYEIYLALQRMSELRPDWAGRIRAVLDDVRRIGKLPNASGFRSTQVLPDPDLLLGVRVRAGELLDELLASEGSPVSGRVVDSLGRAMEGMTLVLSGGAAGEVKTGPGGEWTIDDVRGYAIVTPKKPGWSFSPSQALAPAGASEVVFVATPPAPKVGFAGWRDGSAVKGVIRPQVVVEWPDPPAMGEVAEVVLRFDGELVYQGNQLPEELVIDTLSYPDGRYQLEVEIAADYGRTARAAVSLAVDNWWEIDDGLKPPMDLGWFGTVDQSKTSAESSGWAYATDNAPDFGGDGDRKVRSADTAEYLIWDAPALTSFEVTVYATKEDLSGIVGLSIFTRDSGWQAVAYDTDVEPLPATGWFAHRLTGTVDVDQGVEAFRLDVYPGGVPFDEIQVGHVKLVGRN